MTRSGKPPCTLHLLLVAPGLATCQAFALTPLNEGELSSVAGRDGISIHAEISNPDIRGVTWETDPDPDSGPSLQLANMGIQNTDGSAYTGSPFTVDMTVDMGGGSNPLPMIGATLAAPEFRLYVGDVIHNGIGAGNGQIAMDTAFTLQYTGPLLSDTTSSGLTSLALDMQPSRLFYRQGSAGAPELSLHNLELDFSVSAANLNADSAGLILAAPRADVKLVSDFSYDASGSSSFALSNADRPILSTGWSGGLENFVVRLNGGGSWSGGDENIGSRSEGLNLALRWDFASDFQWILGEPADPMQTPRLGTTLLFNNWQSLNTSVSAFNFPNITLDPLASGQAPAGLCWLGLSNTTGCSDGGTLINLPMDSSGALAVLIRDGHLGAYSSGVTVRDDVNGDGLYSNNGINGDAGNDESWSQNWGLIYSLGDVDANLYLYPGGGNANGHGAGATLPGLRADIALKVQSRARDGGDMDGDGNTGEVTGPSLAANQAYTDFTRGTHFMIADTSKNLAIGYHSADLLYVANDLYLSALNSGLNLQTSESRLQFIGRFGGGTLPDLSTAVKGLDLNANLEFSNFDLTLNGAPSCASPPCATYLQYEADLTFADLDSDIAHTNSTDDTVDDGSFISIAEPGQPDVDLRYARIQGDLAIRNGRLDVESTANNSDADPAKLVLEQDLLFGSTAGGSAFRVERLEFGNRNLGSMVIPSGQWHSRVGLMCQTSNGVCN